MRWTMVLVGGKRHCEEKKKNGDWLTECEENILFLNGGTELRVAL
jgi:hypothetical protein